MSFPQYEVSVIMPTFNQSRFIRRAIASLQAQLFNNWELIIINDGSTDNTGEVVQPFLADARIRYFQFRTNCGLGASLNKGIAAAAYDLIAYLPSDDIYFADHLSTLLETLNGSQAVYSGVRHHYNHDASGVIDGECLQLVQVLHRKSDLIWVARPELVTDDLDVMYWGRLRESGHFVSTGKVTCEWVDHPRQRHKMIREPLGGINPYKLYYGVNQPLRYKSTTGNLIDEISYYSRFEEYEIKADMAGGLKIVLVGELAYNAERIIALEEQGHKLYGLWMRDPHWYNYVGPFPFGNVEEIPYEGWEQRLSEINPDIIYALLNWQAVPFAHEVMIRRNKSIPFVWHFKEGPFICLEKGTWSQLIDLYTQSDGQIYTSEAMRDWFFQFLPGSGNTLVLDGDLPKKEWFADQQSPLLSASDGEVHTVVPGRPIGLHPHTVQALADNKIHLHFYGDFTHGQWKEWIRKTMTLAPGYLHIHSNCSQENWVTEFSQYDAGWLHFFKSENHGDLMRANWDDLNIPARMATLAAAGLPMLQRDNTEHIVATQALAARHDLGFFFTTIEELAARLYDTKEVSRIRQNVWMHRQLFTFDYHADKLVAFFRRVIQSKDSVNNPADLQVQVEKTV